MTLRTPRSPRRRAARRRRGSGMALALLGTLVVVGLGVAAMTVSMATQRDVEASRQHAERKLVAEAGLAAGFNDLIAGGSGNIGSANAPITWGAGFYDVACASNADGTKTLTAYGKSGRRSRGVCAVLRERQSSPFWSAMYAGNSAESEYTLRLGGTGTRADDVEGDIYSGGHIRISGDAAVDGELRAGGTITGATGTEGVEEPAPDLVGAHYETNHDVNVADAFAADGVYQRNTSLGGWAYQLPEENPAHIFRKNPSDRSSVTSATAKDDYFLEDPYENVNSSNSTNPNNATRITLSGLGGEPGVSGTDKVYFIDGNLWVHNLNLYTFTIRHNEQNGVRVTFVVKGNIYMSDNLVLVNKIKDGIALVAVKDADVTDSGNIYFGDPQFGTLERMETFMYAEHNFHDNNLGTSGSPTVSVFGIMSAGNQIVINRGTGSSRTKLELEFDSRVRDGDLDLPGLPEVHLGTGRRSFQWMTKYEVKGRD